MILVTGANGYIGSLLMQRLSQWGETTHAFDGDVSSENHWRLNVQYSNPTAIVHLAAKTNLRFCEMYPNKSFLDNYWSAVLAAKYAREADCPLVFLSTNTDKKYNTVYELDKRSASLAITSMRLSKYVILKLATVYGKTFADTDAGRGVVNYWFNEGKNGRPIVVFREVMNKRRDFVHVADVVKHIGLALHAKSGFYDVCTDRCITMLDAANLIAELTGSFVSVQDAPTSLYPVEMRDEDPYPHRSLDNDWISFEDGLRGMLCAF